MSWAELLTVFLRAAFLSVNGGTTLALLEQDLVQRLRVLSPADFSLGVAVGAATPGPFGYGCIALGFLADGWRGALVATFTSWLPSFLVLPLRTAQRRLEAARWMGGLTWGVAAGGAALLGALALDQGVSSFTGWHEIALGLLLFLLLLRRVPAPLVLGLGALAGALLLPPTP